MLIRSTLPCCGVAIGLVWWATRYNSAGRGGGRGGRPGRWGRWRARRWGCGFEDREEQSVEGRRRAGPRLGGGRAQVIESRISYGEGTGVVGWAFTKLGCGDLQHLPPELRQVLPRNAPRAIPGAEGARRIHGSRRDRSGGNF